MVQAELLRRVNGALAPRSVAAGSARSGSATCWPRRCWPRSAASAIGVHRGAGAEALREVVATRDRRIRSAGYAVHGDLADLDRPTPAGRLPGDVARPS